jgi:hypothetical protein
MSAPNQSACDAWNPGITSQIPESLKPQITLFRAENATVDYQRARELADFCGLSVNELIALRVERLVVHELLVRVTSDLTVPDGPNYEDLGINLRAMVAALYEYTLPEIPAMQKAFDEEQLVIRQFIESEIQTRLFKRPATADNTKSDASWLQRLFGGRVKSESPANSKPSDEPAEVAALANWKQRIATKAPPLQVAALQALVKVVGSMMAMRGRVMNRPGLITDIATNMACNNTGSTLIATLVEPVFKVGVAAHNYRLLPVQLKPVVMNVKGASASGKSTIRPQQRQLADKLNIPWEDFALISPDYWRKYLLDYDSLDDDYKYAAMLTGQELEIVDKKLDHYMAQKAAKGEVSHLLIDRFRFDSFNVDNGGHSRDSRLLSRFGHQIFLYFMITPPAETVVRAWERGQTTGRFKAVDDLLYHNIEAYTGMPDLFLSWVLSGDKQLHFEFLDNSVEKGQLPKTAAFGWNNAMTILDVELMCAVERYKKVNVDAATAADVLTDDSAADHSGFIKRCLGTIKQVSFAESESGNIYAQLRDGKMLWWNKAAVEQRPDAAFLKTLFAEYAESLDDLPVRSEAIIDAAAEKQYTLGQW